MKEHTLKLLLRFLKYQTWIYDEYEYEFIDFKINNSLSFIVNVKTPIKNQSYIKEIFNDKINEILSNSVKYFGIDDDAPFNYLHEIYVNGKKSLDVFVNHQMMNKIIDGLNDTFNKIRFNNFSTVLRGATTANLEFSFPKERNNDVIKYKMDDYGPIFRIDIKISNAKVDKKILSVNSRNESIIFNSFYDKFDLMDFGADLSDFIYNITQPEFKIPIDSNMFIAVVLKIVSINGFNVD